MEDSSRAQLYREKAKRVREKAVNEESLENRQAMENIALQWELLAEGLELAAKRSSSRKAPPGGVSV
jgi:hypothetical protein